MATSPPCLLLISKTTSYLTLRSILCAIFCPTARIEGGIHLLYFGFRFLICNAFLCLFIGVIIGLKKLLGKHLSARIQYNIWLLFLLLLAVPFLPVTFHFGQIVTWLRLPLEKHTLTNHADIQSPIPLTADSTLDKMNDFAVSISTKTPSVVHTLLLLAWGIGILAMLILAFRSLKRLHPLEKSALPPQRYGDRYVHESGRHTLLV